MSAHATPYNPAYTTFVSRLEHLLTRGGANLFTAKHQALGVAGAAWATFSSRLYMCGLLGVAVVGDEEGLGDLEGDAFGLDA